MLGVGRPQVFLADRGGGPLLGEISDVYFLQWNRVRDDISAARIDVRAPDKRCCELLANARTVRHELVILRDGVRVWEGPIIRINYAADRIELEARDPMWYASRRALDVELDYTYPNVGDALSACKIALERAFGTPGNDKFGMRVADFVQVVRSSDDARTAKRSLRTRGPAGRWWTSTPRTAGWTTRPWGVASCCGTCTRRAGRYRT